MINRIKIKNFKSIIEAETELPQYVGALVGKNGVGKTNFIQAINFIRGLVIGETTSTVLRRIALTPLEAFNYNNNDFNKEITFEVIVSDLEERKYKLEIVLQLVDEGESLQKLIIKSELLFRVDDSDNLEIIYKRENKSFTDNNGRDIPLAVDADKVAASIYQNESVLNVKRIFTEIEITDQDAIDFRESIVKKDEKGLASLIVRLKQKDLESYNNFIKVIKKLLPAFSSIVEIPINQDNLTIDGEKSFIVLLQEENLKGKLSMKSLSAGDLRTLYIIASVFSLNEGASFIFEEAENGLHPKRLNDLLGYIDTITRKKELQIIYSTHSPSVINKLSAEKVVYVDKDPIKGTQFILLSESQHITEIKKVLNEGLVLTDYLFNRMQ